MRVISFLFSWICHATLKGAYQLSWPKLLYWGLGHAALTEASKLYRPRIYIYEMPEKWHSEATHGGQINAPKSVLHQKHLSCMRAHACRVLTATCTVKGQPVMAMVQLFLLCGQADA